MKTLTETKTRKDSQNSCRKLQKGSDMKRENLFACMHIYVWVACLQEFTDFQMQRGNLGLIKSTVQYRLPYIWASSCKVTSTMVKLHCNKQGPENQSLIMGE